ncbi:MAG: DNA polymerase III subunit beta [Acidobacteria bacterium]|nr:MAG: DNA polymerase III subunit beta [Acidobacteriota bacterium]
MEFVARTADLLQELSLVQGVVERKTTIPILSNVRLDARDSKKGGEIEIVATDLEVGVRTVCPAVVKKTGAMTLPARRLHEIVRLLPDSEVEFNARDGSWVNIACERIKYRLAGAGTADFPTLPDYDFKDSISLPLLPLKGMIERIIFAITTEDPRFALNGALLNTGAGKISLVATDGHRLALITRTDGSVADKEIRVIVPRKTLVELLRFEPGPEGEVRFGLHGNQMFFKMGRRLLQSSVVEGTFPNYEKVLPEKNDRLMTVATEAFRGALGRVSLLSQERSRLVKLSIDQGKLVLSTQNPEMGEAEETIASEYDGPPFQVGFNARYLAEFLDAAGSPRIRLELRDETAQGLFRPDEEQEWDYRYVVMPMRLT